jgi:Protein of Unknown function (DUF2784)
MSPTPQKLATAILLVHLGIVAFNIFGLVAVPMGKWLGWPFVRGYWWRLAHLLALAVVALQAVLGRACFLTLWEDAFRFGADAGEPPPLIATWVNGVLYWPLPLWVFAAIYVAVFAYALLLWRWVPPRRSTLRRLSA